MSDLDIIKEIEKELKKELPKRRIGEELPTRLGSDISRTFEDMLDYGATGIFLDEEDRVIAFAINGGFGDSIVEIPQDIFKLKHLKILMLDELPIKTISGRIKDLTKLVALSFFQDHELTSLPSEIWQLSNLTKLYLQGEKITTLPPEIGQLTNLTDLYLNSNNLTTLPPEIGQLTNLTDLYLENNQLTSLPPEIGQLPNLKTLRLNNNKLTTPPQEIAIEGIEAIRNYFDSIAKEEIQHLFEAKLLVIGDGGTGKTTFTRKIRDPEAEMPEDEETTRGIDVKKWSFPTSFSIGGKLTDVNFHVNLWDFGGQRLYQGTHQIFFSDKSYYVLVDATREQATDFSYWLNTVQQLAGNDSSVLILLNRKHGHVPSFDERGYKGHFGKIIKDVFDLDLSGDADKLLLLKETVKNHIKQLPEIGNKLPASWVRIREALLEEAGNFISFDRFREVCAEHGTTDPSVIRTLSGYYTRIGAITHYLDDALLRDRIYLDSNWLVKTVYMVLDSEKIQEKQGRLTKAEVEAIWNKNDLDFEIERLAQLMNRFGLMYKVPGQDRYVVPEHLPKEQPYETWPQKGQVLHFVYEFDKYMPPGLMSRIIVVLHRLIRDHTLVWHQGVNIELEDTYAEIIESYGTDNSFEIRIVGANKVVLLSVIREHFAKVLEPFRNLNYDQLVPCCCSKCEGTNPPEFHKFKDLQNPIVKENGSQCKRIGKLIHVEDLLRITIFEKTKKRAEAIPKIDTSKLKNIKLFLASSSELEDDRKEVEIWASRKNTDLVKRGYNLQVVLWENFLDAMSPTRLQDEYNKAIKDCDIFVSLFAKKIGKFTEEEVEVAFESFLEAGKPEYVYTYFKKVTFDDEDDDDLEKFIGLKKFKKKLSALGHFHTRYDSISNLKEQLGNQFDKILAEMQ